MKVDIQELHDEFVKAFPDPNSRASLDSYGSVYVHWLEEELIRARAKLKLTELPNTIQDYSPEKEPKHYVKDQIPKDKTRLGQIILDYSSAVPGVQGSNIA